MGRARTKSVPAPFEEVSPTFEQTPVTGRRLGRHELLFIVGRGGMAEVWAARQSGPHGFSRLVAVKLITPDRPLDARFREMFLAEARIAARIRHVNVLEVIDLGEEMALVYQVMPLVEGDSLAGLLRRASKGRGVPPAIAARIVSDALLGLHAAHELTDDDGRPLGLVHRDVSPQNILVGIDGIAKISDFGVAKAVLASDESTGGLVGKFSYFAPEQVNRASIDRRTDVFAAGIVLWEALAGRRLFRGDDDIQTLFNVTTMPIPDVRDFAPTIPGPVANVIARALERSPAQRFPTAQAMAEALTRASEAGQASNTEVGEWVRKLVEPELARRQTQLRSTGPTPASSVAIQNEAVTLVTERVGTTQRNSLRSRAIAAMLAVVGSAALAAVWASASVSTGSVHPPPVSTRPPVSASTPRDDSLATPSSGTAPPVATNAPPIAPSTRREPVRVSPHPSTAPTARGRATARAPYGNPYQ